MRSASPAEVHGQLALHGVDPLIFCYPHPPSVIRPGARRDRMTYAGPYHSGRSPKRQVEARVDSWQKFAHGIGPMTVFVYVDTSKQVGDAEHVKVFANGEAAEAWLAENDPEGVTFEYEVIEPPVGAGGL